MQLLNYANCSNNFNHRYTYSDDFVKFNSEFGWKPVDSTVVIVFLKIFFTTKCDPCFILPVDSCQYIALQIRRVW